VKKHFIVILAALALAIGCQDKAPKTEGQPVQEKSVVDESAGGFSGTVAEIIKVERCRPRWTGDEEFSQQYPSA